MPSYAVTWGPMYWNPDTGVITVTIVANDAPPTPNDGGNYSPPSGTQLTMDMTVRRRASNAPTIIRYDTSPEGFIYTLLTWNGTAWANPTRVNADGTPYKA